MSNFFAWPHDIKFQDTVFESVEWRATNFFGWAKKSNGFVSIYTMLFDSYTISIMTLVQLQSLAQCSRINDNNFSGAIPNFIQNWKQLGRL